MTLDISPDKLNDGISNFAIVMYFSKNSNQFKNNETFDILVYIKTAMCYLIA